MLGSQLDRLPRISLDPDRLARVTTTCDACGGTGTQESARPRRLSELSDEQLQFLVDADIEELKLANPMAGDEEAMADAPRPAQTQHTHQPGDPPVELPDGQVPAPNGSSIPSSELPTGDPSP